MGRPCASKVSVPENDVGAVVVHPIEQGHTPLFCIKIILHMNRYRSRKPHVWCQDYRVPSVLSALCTLAYRRPGTQTVQSALALRRVTST